MRTVSTDRTTKSDLDQIGSDSAARRTAYFRLSIQDRPMQTRKLSYRKDDRAMRPIYECSEKFRESLTMPTASFPENFNGLFFRLMLRICVQNLKLVALPVPEIIWGTHKCGQSLDTPTRSFLQNF